MTYIAVRNTQRCAGFEDAFDDVQTNDDRVGAIEARIRDHLNKQKKLRGVLS